MVRTEGQNILKFLLAQATLKMKMFFEREIFNPNNEKYLLKTLSYIYYIIYGSTTTTIAG